MEYDEESEGTSEGSDADIDVEVDVDDGLEEDGSEDEEEWDGGGGDEGDDLVEDEGESIPFDVEVRYQACSEQECFMPRTHRLHLEVPVVPLNRPRRE